MSGSFKIKQNELDRLNSNFPKHSSGGIIRLYTSEEYEKRFPKSNLFVIVVSCEPKKTIKKNRESNLEPFYSDSYINDVFVGKDLNNPNYKHGNLILAVQEVTLGEDEFFEKELIDRYIKVFSVKKSKIDEEDIINKMSRPTLAGYIYVEDGIGNTIEGREKKDWITIFAICVEPNKRRFDIGTTLISSVLSIAKEKGKKYCAIYGPSKTLNVGGSSIAFKFLFKNIFSKVKKIEQEQKNEHVEEEQEKKQLEEGERSKLSNYFDFKVPVDKKKEKIQIIMTTKISDINEKNLLKHDSNIPTFKEKNIEDYEIMISESLEKIDLKDFATRFIGSKMISSNKMDTLDTFEEKMEQLRKNGEILVKKMESFKKKEERVDEKIKEVNKKIKKKRKEMETKEKSVDEPQKKIPRLEKISDIEDEMEEQEMMEEDEKTREEGFFIGENVDEEIRDIPVKIQIPIPEQKSLLTETKEKEISPEVQIIEIDQIKKVKRPKTDEKGGITIIGVEFNEIELQCIDGIAQLELSQTLSSKTKFSFRVKKCSICNVTLESMILYDKMKNNSRIGEWVRSFRIIRPKNGPTEYSNKIIGVCSFCAENFLVINYKKKDMISSTTEKIEEADPKDPNGSSVGEMETFSKMDRNTEISGFYRIYNKPTARNPNNIAYIDVNMFNNGEKQRERLIIHKDIRNKLSKANETLYSK